MRVLARCLAENAKNIHVRGCVAAGRRQKNVKYDKKWLSEWVMGKPTDTKKAAQELVDGLFDEIIKTMVRGEQVKVAGFGVFKVSRRAAREGVNPRTGEKIQIAAKVAPKFRAAKQLKEAVK